MTMFFERLSGSNHTRQFLVFTLCCSLFTLHTFAQEIKSEQVDIVKAYQPLLADAVKIQLHAEPSSIDTTMQPLKYDVVKHVIEVPFIPADIRPIALPQEQPAPIQNNLLKAGFGTQVTPLIELYLGNGRSNKFSYGLNLHHISSNPGNIDFQDASHTGGSLSGRSYFKNTELSGNVDYDRRVHYFYGFDPGFIDSSGEFTKDLLRQKFENIGVNAGLKNSIATRSNFDYSFNFRFHDFERRAGDSAIHSATENYYRFDFSLAKAIQKIHSAHMDFNFQKEYYKSVGDTSISYFSILPNYQYHSGKADLRAGVNVNVVNRDVKLYPELFGSYKIVGEYVIPYFGFSGGTNPSTLRQMAEMNPFIGNADTLPSSEKIEVYAGIKGSYGNNISYNAKLSYTDQKNVLFFLPDQEIPTHFIPVFYYDAKIIGGHAEIGFRQSERLNLLLTGDAYSYNLDFNDQPWGLPKSKLSLSINYNLQKKIFFDVNVFAQSGAYTIIPGDSVTTQRKGFADLNFGAAYNYKSNISFWLSLNNIASLKEREWYNYPYYGVQAIAGVILKF